ncbi:MAG: transcriptional regulator [Verrucomicrobia bacterium]|jgi:predicted ArsR family transcriptional regulator|nr:transcriptional regulator [Verrucomicrobiota bacterium]
MEDGKAFCKLLTNHAHVLLYLHAHPEETLRKVALAVGVTERAVQLMVADLEAAGYLSRRKIGRRNQYTLRTERPLQHPMESAHTVGDFLHWANAVDGDASEEDRVLENWTVGEHGSEVR